MGRERGIGSRRTNRYADLIAGLFWLWSWVDGVLIWINMEGHLGVHAVMTKGYQVYYG